MTALDLSTFSDNIGWIVAIVLGLLTLAALTRKGWRKIRRAIKKGNDVVDTLVGRDAIYHPESGKELEPASPGIGARMVRLEDAFLTLVSQEDRISTVEHNQLAQGRRIDTHDDEIAELKAQSVERVVTRAESAAAWRAVEAIASTAPDEPEPDL